ncbi:MAG: hypothetical protein GTN81_09210 [Proteobacteria bacterium]|nr:hypothetical protein [Pseudomonadota bacterium]
MPPGPEGLPGSYPVRVGRDGGRIDLPSDLTLDEAIRINEEGQRYDGIDRIDQDGTAYFTGDGTAIMREMMGYDCRVLKLEETEARAAEVGVRFRELVKKHQSFTPLLHDNS